MEGYIGGGLLTVILGIGFTRLCVEYGYPSLICPAEANHEYLSYMLDSNNGSDVGIQSFLYTPKCQIQDVFLPQMYQVYLFQINDRIVEIFQTLNTF